MSEGSVGGAQKEFVLDTSTLVHAPECVDPTRSSFGDNNITIPYMVLEELDNFKSERSLRGESARRVVNMIDAMFPSADAMRIGRKMDSGGVLRIAGLEHGAPELPVEFSGMSGDKVILRLALQMQQKFGESRRVVLITKDIAFRAKARAAGLDAEDLKTGKVDNPQSLGPRIIDIDTTIDTINELYRNKLVPLHSLELPPQGLLPNTCCRLIASDTRPALGIFLKGSQKDSSDDRIVLVSKNGNQDKRVIVPRNAEQILAYSLAMRREIHASFFVGRAGTGKTLIALRAAIDLLETDGTGIKNIVVFRPLVHAGGPENDLGYLPGDVHEKFEPWAAAIKSNLRLLYARRNNGNGNGAEEAEGKKHHGKMDPEEKLKKLLFNNTITIQPVTFVRGITLPNTFIIMDEAQNLTPHEVKTLLTRAGEGSRMVLTGDLSQIDNPRLDAASCGLAKALERMKGHPMFGAIELVKGERSLLATVVSELLDDL